jgi:cell division protein FtsN
MRLIILGASERCVTSVAATSGIAVESAQASNTYASEKILMHKVVLTLGLALMLMVSACSRQQSDWEKTRAANTTDAYELFLKKYPKGEFTAQAQARLKELYEERDWQKARDVDSAEAYQAFLKQDPEGKWSEEARIRIENFTLASAPSNTVPSSTGSGTQANAAAAAASPSPPRETAPSAAPQKKPAKRPVKAAATPAKPSTPNTGGYSVQLGAFKTGAATANQRWARLSAKYPKVLEGLSPKVAPRQEASGTMYRLQVLSLSDTRAHSICKSLKAHSEACIVVKPGH